MLLYANGVNGEGGGGEVGIGEYGNSSYIKTQFFIRFTVQYKIMWSYEKSSTSHPGDLELCLVIITDIEKPNRSIGYNESSWLHEK